MNLTEKATKAISPVEDAVLNITNMLLDNFNANDQRFIIDNIFSNIKAYYDNRIKEEEEKLAILEEKRAIFSGEISVKENNIKR